jgi:hypothetical protein
MNLFKTVTTVTTIITLSQSCVTSSQAQKPRKNIRTGTIVPSDKAGSKSAGDSLETTGSTSSIANRPVSADRRYNDFIARHQSADSELTLQDMQLLRVLTNANQGTPAQEAVLVLGALKDAYTPPEKNFEESDLLTQESQDAGLSPSLEARARRYGVNLSSVILNNPFVQTPGILSQITKKLEKSTDSSNYRADILSSVQTVLKRYKEVEQNIASNNSQSRPLAIVTYPPETSAADMENKSAAAPSANAPLNGVAGIPPVGGAAAAGAMIPGSPSDSMGMPNAVQLSPEELALNEAQSLADAGKFEQAVSKLSAIQPSSAQYANAQQRAKLISNKGVQDLRQKAAQAFQGSLPLSDPNARVPYLEKAKTYLEDALRLYPNSDQIGTVKDNLAVINRDLEKVKLSN